MFLHIERDSCARANPAKTPNLIWDQAVLLCWSRTSGGGLNRVQMLFWSCLICETTQNQALLFQHQTMTPLALCAYIIILVYFLFLFQSGMLKFFSNFLCTQILMRMFYWCTVCLNIGLLNTCGVLKHFTYLFYLHIVWVIF